VRVKAKLALCRYNYEWDMKKKIKIDNILRRR